MTLSLLAIIPAVDDVLFNFAQSDGFWANLETAFGTSYDVVKATQLRQQWQSRNFGQLPPIEVLSDEVLGTANGAYSSSKNKIYLSASFLNTASSATIVNVILEEIGHYVDAQVNQVDSAGDEGAIFAELVQGNSLDAATLDALRGENDQTTIIVNGEIIQVEQANFTGTNGNDNIVGTSGDDTISPLRGFDTVNGGAGSDLLIIDYSSNSYAGISSNYSGNGSGYFKAFYNFSSYDQVSYSNTERFQIKGTNFNDSISTGDGSDSINPGLGIDTVNGGNGTDTLIVDFTNLIDPDIGVNNNGIQNIYTVDYYGSYYGQIWAINNSYKNFTTFSSIENFNITGTIYNDNLIDRAGNDTLNGGAGDDSIKGGVGDNLDGGAGTDTLSLDLSDVTTDVVVDFNFLSGTTNIQGANNTQVKNFEQIDVIFTGSGNDTIKLISGTDLLLSSPYDRATSISGNGGINTLIVDFTNLSDPSIGTNNSGIQHIFTYDDPNNYGGLISSINASYESGNFITFSGIAKFNITGTIYNDNLISPASNDTLNGGAGDDFIRGGVGDNLDGGAGTDTLHLDLSNVTTDVVVDLNFLAGTNNIQGANNTQVKNFEQIDVIFTGSGNDTIKLISGTDFFGSSAFYTPRSVSGNGGTDTLIVDFTNLIDPSIGTNNSGIDNASNGVIRSINASYDSGYFLSFSFIENLNITGTIYNDNLVGFSGNDTLNGGAGNDSIASGDGNDIINGVNPNSSSPGRGEIDTLTGGAGSDKFILGDLTWIGYDDGSTTNAGTSDYATITDFNTTDDIIQLRGSSSDYLLTVSGSITNLYINKPGNEADELIAYISNQTALSLTASYFSYVSSPTLPSITLAVSPASVTEDGTTNLVYTFTRTGVTTDALTVNYTVSGTATNGTDYASIPTSVTFAAGSATATVIVDPTADTTVESDETVILTLAAGTGYTVGTPNAATGTITNDDLPSITLAVAPSSVTEDGTTNLVYTFTRTGVTTNSLTVNYSISGTATNGTDYTSIPTSVTFAAGSATATVTVDPTADTIVESNETVILTLAAGTGYTIGTTTPVTGTITNDDLPSITLAVSPSSVTEDGTTNLVYTFTRTGVTTNTLTVNYTLGGTATLNTDYTRTGTTNTVTFAAGSATATVTVDPTADTTVESNETVILTLAAGTGYTIGTTTPVTGTINNDDSASISINDVTVSEGNSGTTNAVFTVTLSNPVDTSVTLNYATANGTATTADNDYTAIATTPLTFNVGETSKTITVAVNGDTKVENNETFFVNLSNLQANGRNVTITDNQGQGTINDDDSTVTSQLSINDITVVEGQNSNAILTVTVNNPSTQQITVNYTTTAIDATANVDYTSQTGTITIAPNTSTATISIPILNDNLNEPDEAFTVTLSNAVNATINPDEAIGQVIITDTLQSSITRTLPNNVENLRLIGSNNINGTGNAGDNKITGNSGNNILAGANGNDIYCFNASTPLGSDTIQETTTGGIDTLDFTGTNTAVRVNLGTTAVQTAVTNNLKLTFSANNTIENIISDSGNDRLTGNSLNNTLTGGGGNDQLTGQNGNDSLIGGSGDDLLTGGNGSDNFIFNSSNLGIDAISDFTSGSDKIVLSKAIFTALQSSIGNGFSQPAEFASVADDDLVATSSAFIVYSTSSGSIYYNQNGSAAGLGSGAEFASLLTVPTLIAADFALIN
ncbi:MAG: M10 family metallopeptidase C-terminal domain-containing protein [Microcystis sp. LE19-84.1B]|uniref:beta strand repeat-containing protein n=1 Tax=Microcystis sp. LE19-84.1B TaxID=3016438 RepID=UPI0022BAAF9A|nr:Calx-beta domain-containing protein [Microcystis sp. LE19-84.1B]MCZ8222503.1 M10 family metallopeptidase C-terminal domain-containing protein [Microcystis sp. LE19-84.1B]